MDECDDDDDGGCNVDEEMLEGVLTPASKEELLPVTQDLLRLNNYLHTETSKALTSMTSEYASWRGDSLKSPSQELSSLTSAGPERQQECRAQTTQRAAKARADANPSTSSGLFTFSLPSAVNIPKDCHH